MHSKQLVLAATAVLAALLSPGYAWAQDETDNTIEPQPLTKALAEFAEQTGMQLVYPSELTAGIESSGASVMGSPDEILDELLASTGLEFEYVNDRTIAIAAQAGADRSTAAIGANDQGGDSDSKNSRPTPVMMVQNTRKAQASTVEGTTEDDVASDSLHTNSDTLRLPEIIVVGKSRNADIQRFESDVQPYVVFSSLDLDNSMAVNLEDFFRTRLPMNSVQTVNAQGGNNLFGNQSSINLRGLGADQTLILVNGRRMPSISTGTSFVQPDINGIPLESIERIEVLPSTASAIHGGGATGGVINIITRSDYVGVNLDLKYGDSFDFDVSDTRVYASGGFSFNDNRTVLAMSAHHAERSTLLVGDRDFANNGRALAVANGQSEIAQSIFPPIGSTSNIRSMDGQNLVLDTGTSLGSPIAHVPSGYAGVQQEGDSGAAFLTTAGLYNWSLSNDYQGSRGGLLNGPTTWSGAISLRQEFNDVTSAYIDYFENSNKGSFPEAATPLFRQTIAADAPNNPFDADVFVQAPAPALIPPERRSETGNKRALTGIVVGLPNAWSANLDFTWSESSTEASMALPVTDPLQTNAAVASGAIDLLVDMNEFPQPLGSVLVSQPTNVSGPQVAELQNIAARFAGPVLELAGGAITSTLMFEKRDETIEAGFNNIAVFDTLRLTSYFPRSEREVQSAYLELVAPIISAKNSRAGVSSLEFQASLRHDDYSYRLPEPGSAIVPSRDSELPDVVSVASNLESTDYMFGIRYEPAHGLVLRASFATGFLPPSLQQLRNTAEFVTPLFIRDPKRGNTLGLTDPILVTRQLNSNLEPEESESTSVGVIYNPPQLENLRVSIDYTRISKTDEIQALSDQQIVDLEDSFPGRVTRGELEPDAPTDYTAGPIIAVDLSRLNVATTEIEVIDFQINYNIQSSSYGSFDFYVLGTATDAFENRITTLTPAFDTTGSSDGPLQLRGNLGMNWSRGPWSLSWNAQYYDSYTVTSPTFSDVQNDFLATIQGSQTIPSQTYHELLLRYDFGARGVREGSDRVKKVAFSLGVQNVFDKSPPTIATTTLGGYSTFGDPRLRSFTVELGMEF